jgi:hypothetical protein
VCQAAHQAVQAGHYEDFTLAEVPHRHSCNTGRS